MASYIDQPLTVNPRRAEGLIDLWRNAARHKYLFSAITCTFFAAGCLYVLVATPQYRADALLRLQSTQGSSISALSGVSGTMTADQSANDESDILRSRTIVGDAIAETGAEVSVETASYFPLFGRFLATRRSGTDELAPPFLGLSSYAWGGELLRPGVFELPSAVLGRPFSVVAGEAGEWTLFDGAGAQLAQGHTGELVTFNVATPDGNGTGKLRIDILRARPGVKFLIRRQPLQAVYANVDKQLKTSVTSEDTATREPSLIRLSYQAENPIAAQIMVNAIVKALLKRDVELRADQVQRSLDFLRGRLPGLKQDLEAAEDRLNDFRTKTRIIDMEQQSAALVSRMNALADRETTLQLDLVDRQEKYMPDTPAYQVAQSQLQQVQRELADTAKAAANLPSTQREYVRLSRDVAVSTQLYTSVLTNTQQLEVAAASTAPGIAVVDWAIAPESQSWPRNGLILLGSLLGGLFVSAAIVQLVSRNRKEFLTPEELDDVSVLPRLAVVAESAAQLKGGATVPKIGAPVRLLAMNNPTDPSVEALRSLRSSLRPLLADAQGQMKHKVILFTGPTRGVGKSFVASNFAYLLAETGANVLLIDADLRQGKLGLLVHGENRMGLAEVLEFGAPVEDAIIRLEESGLWMLDAGAESPANPAELLGRPAFRELLATLRERYDFVVVDSPPVLPVSDALSIAAQGSDLVLVVSRADVTGARQLEETVRRLLNSGAKVGGHIFNGFSPGGYGEREEYGFNNGKRKGNTGYY
jgi:tyrosine-protein kinase Etk/Wzc